MQDPERQHNSGLKSANTNTGERRMEAPGSLAELNRLFNLSLDILCISSSDGYFKLVNPAFTSTLGWSEEELLSRPYMSFVHPDDVDSTSRNVERQVVAGEKVLCFENRYRHKAGSWRLLEWTSMPQSGGLMYATARDITERKRAEERIRLFTHELIAVREEEKQRVSSVLHHDVGSLAVGLSAHFDALEDGIRCGKTREAIRWMKRTRNLFYQSLARLKELAVELRPPELDLLGLSAALRHHFSQVTGLGNVRINFVQNLGKRRLPGEVATVVFRIIQEALTNAIKHGGAKRVDVRISASKKKLSFSVRDDGKGFSPAQGGRQKSHHLGLRLMEEMATSVGGIVNIDSLPGEATSVSVVLPLAPGQVTWPASRNGRDGG